MKLEDITKLNEAVVPLIENAEQLLAYAKSIQYKTACIIDGEVKKEELEEKISEASKMRGKLNIYGSHIKGEVEYIVKHL